MNQKLLLNTIEKCIENSRELYEEAEILRNHKKFARAYTLYHLSIEEIGKVFIIYNFILEENYDKTACKKFDKNFTDHKTKIALSVTIMQIAFFLKRIIPLKEIEKINYTSKNITSQNNLKNQSLYTFLYNGTSFKPSDIINNEKYILETKDRAEIFLLATEQFLETVIPNIDKLIKLSKTR
jgi:AbiV family abortive infection protein